MPSCLPVKSLMQSFIPGPNGPGRADGRPGPYRPLIVTESSSAAAALFMIPVRHWPAYKNASLDPHLAVRASECLPVKIIDAKFNLTTIFPDRTGRAGPGRAGPTAARPVQPSDRTERSIIIVESNQNVESKMKNVESKVQKCGVHFSPCYGFQTAQTPNFIVFS